MKLNEIIATLDAECLNLNKDNLDIDYKYIYTSSKMSNVLYDINENIKETILITNLTNSQTIRTLEMLDMNIIIFATHDNLKEEIIKLAKDNDITVLLVNDDSLNIYNHLSLKGMVKVI